MLKSDLWVADKKHFGQNLNLGDPLLDLVLHKLIELWINLDEVSSDWNFRNKNDWAHRVSHLSFKIMVELLVQGLDALNLSLTHQVAELLPAASL